MNPVAKTASMSNIEKPVDHRRRIKILIILLAIQAIFIVAATFLSAGKDNIKLTLETQTKNANKGDTVDIDVILESNKKINGVELFIMYPEEKFAVVSVIPTSDMPIAIDGPTINPSYFSMSLASQPSTSIDGKVIIAKIKLQALEVGTHELSFGKESRVTISKNNEFVSPKTEIMSVSIIE